MKRRTSKAIILKPLRKGKTSYTLLIERSKRLTKLEAILNRSLNIYN